MIKEAELEDETSVFNTFLRKSNSFFVNKSVESTEHLALESSIDKREANDILPKGVMNVYMDSPKRSLKSNDGRERERLNFRTILIRCDIRRQRLG